MKSQRNYKFPQSRRQLGQSAPWTSALSWAPTANNREVEYAVGTRRAVSDRALTRFCTLCGLMDAHCSQRPLPRTHNLEELSNERAWPSRRLSNFWLISCHRINCRVSANGKSVCFSDDAISTNLTLYREHCTSVRIQVFQTFPIFGRRNGCLEANVRPLERLDVRCFGKAPE